MEENYTILPQPNEYTCGPTCLHSVYNYWKDDISLDQVISEVQQIDMGGTLGVMLGNHALERGFKVRMYTYNLFLFDPSWFVLSSSDLIDKLKEQLKYKTSEKLTLATEAYIKFIEKGGEIRFKDLTPDFISSILNKRIPILTGLSATYLYNSKREIGETNSYDDVKGEPSGHFVAVLDYKKDVNDVLIGDPYQPNPIANTNPFYHIGVNRLINSIMLGIVTYDANLLIIEPK